jgi:hypothetical protein
MNDLNLPPELEAFLREGKQLEYDPSSCEAGEVNLKSLSELEPGVVWISPDISALRDEDPHANDDGYYEVPAVSLTGKCQAYNPEFILLWLPSEKVFGTWDSDHWELRVFAGKTWKEIVAEPSTFLNAQWYDYECKISEYFNPYGKYEFKLGRPF